MCLIESQTTEDNLKMLCFVCMRAVCVRKLQQNIQLDMLLFRSANRQHEKGRLKQSHGKNCSKIQRPYERPYK